MHERAVDGRRAADAPPGKNDQKRQPAEKPEKRGISAGDQRIAGLFAAGGWYGRRDTCQRVKQRQDLPWTGRTAGVGSTAIDVFDLAIGLVAAPARETLPRAAKSNRYIWHCALELCQHVALQVGIARILGSEMHGHQQREPQRREQLLISRRKGIPPAF